MSEKKGRIHGHEKSSSVVRMNDEERTALIKENPEYGKIICRCETVTEGEIMDAVHRPIPAASIDAVKRRCNAGMGRCQGGFCGPSVQEIIARELKNSAERCTAGPGGNDYDYRGNKNSEVTNNEI